MLDPYSSSSTLRKNRVLGRIISHTVNYGVPHDPLLKERLLKEMSQTKRLLARLKPITWRCSILGCEKKSIVLPKHFRGEWHFAILERTNNVSTENAPVSILKFNLSFCGDHYRDMAEYGGFNGKNVYIDSKESKYALIELSMGAGHACGSSVPVRFQD